MTQSECGNVNVTIKGHQARHQSRRLYMFFLKKSVSVHFILKDVHQMLAVPPESTWGSVEHRKHMELAKLPETKTRLLLLSSTCIGTGPDFPLSLRQHLKIRLACLWTARCGVQLGFVSPPPPAAVVSPCCVRGEVWNAAPVAAHCRLSLWYVRVDTEVHSFVQEFNSLTQLRER